MLLPKGIIFDLDDTILAFDDVVESTWQWACEKYSLDGQRYEPHRLLLTLAEVREWFWSDEARHQKGRLDLVSARRVIVREALNRLDVRDDVLANRIADAYSVEREKRSDLFPGAEETLDHLVGKGVSLSLVTNGAAETQRRKINRFNLERFFQTILIEGEVGYGKPDERIYRRALDSMGLDATEVWVVGDNLQWEVAAPQKLGIFAVWNDFRNDGLPAESDVVPDRIINRISELIDAG